MNTKAVRGNLLLLLTSFIWGVAFVSQRVGLDHLGAVSFNSIRTMVGGLALVPVVIWNQRRMGVRAGQVREGVPLKGTVLGGVVCGVILCMATNLQQAGLLYTTVGKAGFITALYILIVPIFGLFIGKKVRGVFWVAVGLAVVGMYLLTMSGTFQVSQGDVLVLVSSVLFAAHILAVDYFSPKADGIMMSMVQFFVSAAIGAVVMVAVEKPQWGAIVGAWAPILYSGVMSCGVGYTLQIIAQKDVNPVVASLMMSLESVFAVLSGWVLLGQTLSMKELGGCALMFGAIVIAQLPPPSAPQRETAHQPIG